MTKLIQHIITQLKAELTPDLLKKEWREKAKDQHYTFGHCYVASEALYHLLGADKSSFRPYYGKDEMGTHWWLVNMFNGDNLIIDKKTPF